MTPTSPKQKKVIVVIRNGEVFFSAMDPDVVKISDAVCPDSIHSMACAYVPENEGWEDDDGQD